MHDHERCAFHRSISMLNTTSWQVQGHTAPSRGGTGQGGVPFGGQGTAGQGWGSVYISGKVVGEEATCTDSSGQATVNLTVIGLPAGFSSASVTCKFLPWSTLQDLLDATDQVDQFATHFQACFVHKPAMAACQPLTLAAILAHFLSDVWIYR